jgi:glycosyltransferase involved in cell wall biosynthesis
VRILRVADIPNNRTGGMSRTMYCTGEVLAAEGHEVDYLFGENLEVPGPVQLRRFTVPLKITSVIRGRARQGRRYDVVEIHEPLAAPYCWRRRHNSDHAPLVVFSYGLEERSHRALLDYRRLKGLPVTLKNRYSPLTVVWQAEYAVRHADHVLCSNSEDVRHLRAAGVAPEKLTQHHSGVEAEFLAAGQAEPYPERAGVLFLGSWLARKGILDLIPAISTVMRARPALRFTAAGCGVSADEVWSSFAAELRPRIRVLPSVADNRTLIDLYREHAILALPSYFEGQPLVMIEAAALAMAIVTTGICGMADFITDGENGLTVPVGDVATLADRLNSLAGDPVLARRLGEAARRNASQFTWTNAARRILRAYEHALGQRRE